MENAPVRAISFFNGLIYASSNSLFYNGGSRKFESPIIDIKVFENTITIVFKRHVEVLSSDLTTKITSESFESNIADVSFDKNLHILLYNGIFLSYSLFEASLKLNEKIQIFDKTIISAKVYENMVYIGSFDSIYKINLDKSKNIDAFCFKNIHSGRIFDLFLCNSVILSCADDRSICLNGEKIIQEYTDYFFHVEFVNNKIYTLNRDGYFRVYQKNIETLNFDLEYCKFFGNSALESMFIYNEIVYIGTKGGNIYKIQENILELIFGPKILCPGLQKICEVKGDVKLYESGIIYQNGFIEFENWHFKVPTKPIDCEIYNNLFFLLYSHAVVVVENNFIKTQINYEIQYDTQNKIFSRISIYKDLIYLYNCNFTYILCIRCFDVIRIIECRNINVIKNGILGTKFGCIISGDDFVKVSENSIKDIYIENENIYILDSQNVIFKTEKASLNKFEGHCCLKVPRNTEESNIQDILIENWNSFKNNNHQFQKPVVYSDVKVFDEVQLNFLKFLDIPGKTSILYNKIEKTVSQNECNVARYHKMNAFKSNTLFSYRNYENIKNIVHTGLINGVNNFYCASNGLIEKFSNFNECKITTNFFNFTSSELFSELKVLGTEHGQLFLIDNMKLIDSMTLIGAIIGIFTNNCMLFAFTRSGFIYSIEISHGLMFIRKKLDINEKITCHYQNLICLSNGQVFSLDNDLTPHLIQKTEFYITAIYKNLISFSGCIAYVEDAESSRKELFRRNANIIREANGCFFAAGDDQSVVKFDHEFKELAKAIPHSSQIFDIICVDQIIYTLSSDMRICALDHKLNIIKYSKHSVRNPKFLEYKAPASLLVYGESIEMIVLN